MLPCAAPFSAAFERLGCTARGPGQSGPRDPDPWSTGGLRPKGHVSIRLERELAPEGDTASPPRWS